MSLKNKKIIVGITGGIAAYKIPSLIRLLKKDGAGIHSIMTKSATKFITELTIETVSQFPVAVEMFPDNRYVGTHHIDYAEWPDLFVIAPATANFIGKIASGICDDLLTTVICATQKPVVIAPAMNSNMYLNPVTQKNIEYLKSIGYIFIDPAEGDLACETSGVGRMPEPEEIFDFIKNIAAKKIKAKKKLLKNKKVLVTAGPCREPIDPVRFISNRSSGKMGYALAEAAYVNGADVTLVSGPTSIETVYPIKILKVETTQQMHKAVLRCFKSSDILIMAAAPADFKITSVPKQKIKKKKLPPLELSKTIDILSSFKKSKKKKQRLIGFALETDNGIKNAKAKLKEKDLDLIILNSLEDGQPFDSDTNKVILINRNGKTEAIKSMPKFELAELLIEKISKLK